MKIENLKREKTMGGSKKFIHEFPYKLWSLNGFHSLLLRQTDANRER